MSTGVCEARVTWTARHNFFEMPDVHPASLFELRSHIGGPRPWMLNLVLPEIGGGKATAKDLEPIADRTDATAITISGLDQGTFELLVSKYGRQFTGIHFWKCPRIADLSPLEDLPQLTQVAYYWNQRATRLWDLAATPNLRGLHFDDFRRLHALDDLAAGPSLEELGFGNAVWATSVFASLGPLEGLTKLRHLTISASRVLDGRIQPLASLTTLETLSFPSNLFTTEQCAWLRAHLPESTTGPILGPVNRLHQPLPDGRDTLVIGKRKPFLNSTTDGDSIAEYEARWARMVEEFRAAPDRPPKSKPRSR